MSEAGTPAGTLARRRTGPTDRAPVRTDIQGLRAVAVATVLVYHLWPAWLPGGYVGVDVFFVISGFLITSHLLRHPPTTLSGLGRFWGRRVRRLLPAAALVVVVTVVASAAWLPASRLSRTAAEAAASALYVQNWSLAASATDYLAAADEPTPFLHYWSLAVEEQFYLVWPLLIGGALVAGRRLRLGAHPRWLVAGGVATVLVASLAWSVRLTATDPAAAYFVTPTRMWELALGGLVALAVPRLQATDAIRAVMAWTGLAAILLAAATFDAATPFPGVAAGLPTGGTALVIAAASVGAWGPGRLLAWRPAQVLGDVSYSTYLWHWPVVVLAPFALGTELRWYHLVGVAALSIGLAWVTTRWVEDPVRRSTRLAGSTSATVALLLVGTLGGAGAGWALHTWVGAREQSAAQTVAVAAVEHAECFGAAAVLQDADCRDVAGVLWTTPEFAQADRPAVYDDQCWNNTPFSSRRTCGYGTADADVSIALLGNSHAGHWAPALTELATERGWDLTTYLTSVCYPVDRPLDFTDPSAAEGCTDWTSWALAEVERGGYDLVVLASRTDQPLAGVAPADQDAAARAAYGRVLDRLTAAGLDVLVVRDTFNAGESVPDCVAAAGNDVEACTWPRATAVEADPLAEAAVERAGGAEVTVLDPTDVLCDSDRCHAVVGGVIVLFDHGHLTRTFALTMTPLLASAVEFALED